MKIITVHGDYFLKETAKSWAQVLYYVEHNNILTPIYFDKKVLQQSTHSLIDPPFPIILVSSNFNEDDLQQLVNKEIICLDMRMFSLEKNRQLAETLVKMLFYKESQPEMCLLLVEESQGVEIANIWDQSFFVRSDLAQFFNLGNVQKKLNRKAFLLRWLGDSKITRILYKSSRIFKRILSKIGFR